MKDRATTTTVAQAISRVIDEAQEGLSSLEGGLFLNDAPGAEDAELRVVEVSAELENAVNGMMSQFTVKTSDGQEWNVRITPAPKPVLGTI